MAHRRPSDSRAPTWTQMAFFGCLDCAHRWRSARGEAGTYQKCKYCLEPCYPTGFAMVPPNGRGNMNSETFVGHNQELCGKCTELGYSCQRDREMASSDVDEVAPTIIDFIHGAFAFPLTATPAASTPKRAAKAAPRLSQKERRKRAKEQAVVMPVEMEEVQGNDITPAA
ncbi:Aste57867_8184 [Aphanomyces stellatus]|uniref:Aste57867_8184 protein n=1 Tax=Aphanomyces stellatus TaxID=120398 RepID=A0A485KJN8_9STRA|nr:hypothetical protein As57867_008153 [Aphanomyces stellatus]VFT85072.1 Aste57867_8184 [Aphanomyces stellatus]